MKKTFAFLLTAVIALLCVACSSKESSANNEKKPSAEHNAIITKAIEELKDCWKSLYEESTDSADGYFEIKNTRMITIKNNDIDMFQDMQYIVEFTLYTDYMGTAPYYEDAGIYNTVAVYSDESMDVTSNLIRAYRNQTYETDYSTFIKEIDDYCGYYNCVEKLK